MFSPRTTPTFGTARRILCGVLFAAPALMASDDAPPALFAAGAPGQAGMLAAAPDASGSRIQFQELLLEARVNGLPPPVTLFALRGPDQRLWLAVDQFIYWDMHPPQGPAVQHLGRNYVSLDGRAGLGYRIDEALLTLDITAEPGWFTANRVDSGFNSTSPRPSVNRGAFMNYDVNLTYSDSHADAAGYLEGGVFGKLGVGFSSFLVRNARDYEDGNLLRLDTTWTRDLPERLTRMRIGDTIGGGGAWGRPIRFGGVQWATNFDTQPGFITFPLPAIEGEAALPSTLELYVNGMRRLQSEVPTGPFSIADLPAVTGQGEVRLVVRDLLGREQVITDSFYASSRLLQKGLHEFSYELGAERENFGKESFDYGRAFAAGTHRVGLNDRLTGELRAEVLSGQYTAGIGAALLLGGFGVINAALAGSHSARGNGSQLTVGFERSSRSFGFGFDLQTSSEEFVQLGLLEGESAPRQLARAWLSVPFERAGSASLSYALREERDEPRFESLTASYQVSLGHVGYLNVFASRLQGQVDDTVFGLSLTRLLGPRTTSSTNANFSRDSDQMLVQLRRNLPLGPGYGYRVQAGVLDQKRLDAGVSAQNDIGTVLLDLSHAGGYTGIRAGASGGLAWMDGDLHFGRDMDQSFAVVRVGDFEGIKVYADNQHVATTDRDGRALVPRLRPYEKNPLRIDVSDLPLDAQVAQVEYQAVPYFRSGLIVDFEVGRSRNAIFRLLRANGEPVPAGGLVFLPNGEQFPIGYDGEAFITGAVSGMSLTAGWNGTRCAFQLTLPDNEDPLPDLGTITCAEVAK